MRIVKGNQLHLENDKAVYVHVVDSRNGGDRIIYIDNSTGNMLVEMWDDGDEGGEVKTLNIEEAKLYW